MPAKTMTSFRQVFLDAMRLHGHSQREAAEWINTYMTDHLGHDLKATPQLGCSQAAVSTWITGTVISKGAKGSRRRVDQRKLRHPDPSKWEAVAAYCGLTRSAIRQLCGGDPSDTADATELRESLLEAQAEVRVLEMKVEELVKGKARSDQSLRRARNENRELRVRLEQGEGNLTRAVEELARLRAATPAAPAKATRRRPVSAV